jgi:hypothetical protein
LLWTFVYLMVRNLFALVWLRIGSAAKRIWLRTANLGGPSFA